jgi:hypothetical protein
MNTINKIAINFSPLKMQNFKIKAFRRIKQYGELKEDFFFPVQQRELPILLSVLGSKEDYWITFDIQEGFEEFTCESTTNIGLTLSYLNNEILKKCKLTALLPEEEYFILKERINNTNKIEKIYFVNSIDSSGKQCVWVKAGYLEVTKQFGFYTDFQFKKSKDSKNYIQIQKLSLSLDNHGRSNTNFYTDRYEQLKKFAATYYKRVFHKTSLEFSSLQELNVNILQNKIYQFKNKKEGNLASDLKIHKPYEGVSYETKIYFVYRQDEKYLINIASNKIKALLIENFELNVKSELHEIETTTISSIESFIEYIENENNNLQYKFLVFLPIQNEKVNYYYQCKYEFDRRSIPIQFASYQTLKSGNNWAYDGLTLQIFAKLGGKPWRMKPTNEKCLILGLAQANPKQKLDKQSNMKRFFGYSVLVDSSGLYKSLEVFSNELKKEEYLLRLREHVTSIISQYSTEYQKIVIHTPFRIKNEELDEIRKAIDDTNTISIKFVVIRINVFNDYFGYNKQRNSLVAFESSLVQISNTKYLVWFEGLKAKTDERPNKRFSGPTFIEFHYPQELTEQEKISYLQDIINLSGANWRGFRAKAEPVSIYYCKLVTSFIKQFRAIGYEKLDFKNFQPWFL